MATFKNSLTIIRTFSSSAPRGQLVKAPVQVFGLEGRYATALYSAASKQKQLDVVEKDLLRLQKTFSSDKTLKEFLYNPTISRNLKLIAVKNVSSKMSLSPPSANLLNILAENGRLKNFSTIVNSFEIIMSATRGDLNVEVVVAKTLDSATRQELETTLKKFAKKGENVLIKFKEDPSIIGGMIVSIGDRYVDMSTASKMKRYSDILKSSV